MKHTQVDQLNTSVQLSPIAWSQSLLIWALIIVSVGILYWPARYAPFLLDDYPAIVDNPATQSGVLLDTSLLRNPRALPEISFRMNRMISGNQTLSYHLLNFLIHAINGILLFHLARSTLLRIKQTSNEKAHRLAAVIAWLWVVHPLVTQPVIYIVQRAEMMAATSILLTLLALTYSANSPRKYVWQVMALLSCIAGFYCKPIVVTLPIIVLLWDRTFLAGTFKIAFKQRGVLHALFFASLLLLVVTQTTSLLNTANIPDSTQSAGLTVQTVSPVAYLFAQSQIIGHYLWLCVWPMTLVFDYGWAPPTALGDYAVSFAAMSLLFGITLISLATRFAMFGMLLMLVFLILGPTSSVIPIFDLAVEHRMYLPSACVVAILVLLIHQLLARQVMLRITLLVLVGLLFCGRTYLRADDYRSTISLWQTVIAAVPHHPRAYAILGQQYEAANQTDQALYAYQRAIEYSNESPNHVNLIAHLGLAKLLLQNQQTSQALMILNDTQPLSDGDQQSVHNLMLLAWRQEAAMHARLRRWDLAAQTYENLIKQSPDDKSFYRVYAWLLATCPDDSIRDGQKALNLLNQTVTENDMANVFVLDIKAASLAAIQDYPAAIITINQALELAKSTGDDRLIRRLESHRQSYTQHKPFL
ncbi:MAG TPA: hypothetical protein DCM28_19160, partial [Phycisphaerales bacterium]|nr:hypothetical protein [Phycisphaerales bacterium]